MIETAVTQNTQDWHKIRAGIPTASAAKRLITPTGKPASGEAVEKYMYELIWQRMDEHPVASFSSFWMERGHEEEARAIHLYEFSREIETEPCGFMLRDDRKAGASPDRKQVKYPIGVEIKSPKPENHLMYLMHEGSAMKDHQSQVQFQLWVTGWDAMDLYSFHPELPPALILTERNHGFISTLEEITLAFIEKLEAKWLEMIDRGYAVANPRWPDTRVKA